MEAYFDNSATTKVLDCVKDAVVDAMCVNYGNAAAHHAACYAHLSLRLFVFEFRFNVC